MVLKLANTSIYRVGLSFYRQLIGQTSAIILPLTHFVRDPLYGAERPVIFGRINPLRGADRPTRGGSTMGRIDRHPERRLSL